MRGETNFVYNHASRVVVASTTTGAGGARSRSIRRRVGVIITPRGVTITPSRSRSIRRSLVSVDYDECSDGKDVSIFHQAQARISECTVGEKLFGVFACSGTTVKKFANFVNLTALSCQRAFFEPKVIQYRRQCVFLKHGTPPADVRYECFLGREGSSRDTQPWALLVHLLEVPVR
jgi:hypothetical protein